jgi:hypothetical protein
MMAQLEIGPPRNDRRVTQRRHVAYRNLVVVASEPPQERRDNSVHPGGPPQSTSRQPPTAGPNGLQCTRIAAHTVGRSAAWCRRRSGNNRVSPWCLEPIGVAPGGQADLPTDLSGIRHRLNQEEGPRPHHEAIAAAVVALRAADAVVVGPLAPDDANSPGLLPHLADLASQSYRALRPPRELVIHPAFAQVARRFQYIQMSRQEARALCAGANDIGILAQRLRHLQGDPGEFAITAFGGRGLLWADETWWEIDPIGAGDIDEAVAAGVFCMAWVVARRFRRAPAAQALAYARAAAHSASSRVAKV